MAWKFNPFTNELTYYEKISLPPVDGYEIVNFYVDSNTGNLVVIYEDKT